LAQITVLLPISNKYYKCLHVHVVYSRLNEVESVAWRYTIGNHMSPLFYAKRISSNYMTLLSLEGYNAFYISIEYLPMKKSCEM